MCNEFGCIQSHEPLSHGGHVHEAVGSEASSLPLRPFKAHIFIWRENKRECKKENWSKFTASAKAQRRRDGVFWVGWMGVGGLAL